MPDVSIPPILLLGDPRLRRACAPIADLADPALEGGIRQLQGALHAFRRVHGFGRGIAAPQIGLSWRLVAAHLDGRDHLLFNPVITWHSEQTMVLWDDCMSFPDLRVRVRRPRSVSMRFQDRDGVEHHWEDMGPSLSELFQHELDHLDGVLGVDRGLDREALVLRAVFEADPEHFLGQVDWWPGQATDDGS